MTVADEQQIARYVERVRQSLADLPPAVRDELVEDLPEHLTEVAAEGTGSLVDRLGPPETYAAELRSAAGLGASPRARNLDDRISAAVVKVRGRLRMIDNRVGPLIGYAKASHFLRLLGPAWWVLRGYLAAMLIAVVFGDQPLGLLPRLDGSTLGALLLLAVMVVGSIWLGRRRSRLSSGPKVAVQVASALLLIFGITGFFNADHSRLSGGYEYQPAYNGNPYEHVQDVYVYDREGRLVEGALLFDQNGDSIRLGYPCPEADPAQVNDLMQRGYPYCPQYAPFPHRIPGSVTPAPAPTATPGTTPAPSAQPTTTPVPAVSPT